MFSSTTPLPPQLYQQLINLHYSRRLLLHDPLNKSLPPPSSSNSIDPSELYTSTNTFDANVVMILSVLLCALICSLALNSIIKCALRCSNLVSTNSDTNDPSNQATNRGIKKKALKTFAIVSYSPELKLAGLDSECAICLSEFGSGDRVRLLPKCNHGFHVRCIDKWLNSHSSCPTCRHCLIDTCHKIVDCNQASSSEAVAVQLSQGTVINIPPLEREDLVRCYRGIC